MRRDGKDAVGGQLRLAFAWDVTARSLMSLMLKALEHVLQQRREILCMLAPVSPHTAMTWSTPGSSAASTATLQVRPHPPTALFLQLPVILEPGRPQYRELANLWHAGGPCPSTYIHHLVYAWELSCLHCHLSNVPCHHLCIVRPHACHVECCHAGSCQMSDCEAAKL